MIFAIETSCDETSTAILSSEGKLLSHIIASQLEHQKFGGVVPEIASRMHLQTLQTIIPQSLKEAKVKLEDINIFCATCGPGLVGSLLVGSTMAKSMAIGNDKLFYPINHLEGHILSPTFNTKLNFPYLTILLTGGHTQIYLVNKIGDYRLLGETIDDAVGESFDKVAKLLGLGYPGGPLIEKIARKGDINAFDLPHPMQFEKSLNFSFSGIKTAVSLIIKKQNQISEKIKNDMAASFQNKITEIIKKRITLALEILKKKGCNIKDITIVGGVAANRKMNQAFMNLSNKHNCRLISPIIKLCGDNAAMIAWACYQRQNIGIKSDLSFKVNPRLKL